MLETQLDSLHAHQSKLPDANPDSDNDRILCPLGSAKLVKCGTVYNTVHVQYRAIKPAV